MNVHFKDIVMPVHIWGDCSIRLSGELTRFDSKVHWSDRPVIDYFDPTSDKICHLCRTKYDTILAVCAARAANEVACTETSHKTSNVYLAKLSVCMWVLAATVYFIHRMFQV